MAGKIFRTLIFPVFFLILVAIVVVVLIYNFARYLYLLDHFSAF